MIHLTTIAISYTANIVLLNDIINPPVPVYSIFNQTLNIAKPETKYKTVDLNLLAPGFLEQ